MVINTNKNKVGKEDSKCWCEVSNVKHTIGEASLRSYHLSKELKEVRDQIMLSIWAQRQQQMQGP